MEHTRGTEWTPASERPPSRALLVDCSFSSFIVDLTTSCSTQDILQGVTQDEYDLGVPISTFSVLTAPSLLLSFQFSLILHLSSRALETMLIDTKLPPRGSRTHSHLYSFNPCPVYFRPYCTFLITGLVYGHATLAYHFR